jgi:LacI family transcriptional regulator
MRVCSEVQNRFWCSEFRTKTGFERKSTVSIRKLAQSLGLSVSTVSRALNGYADVNAATRERVERAAREIGYRPHPVAHRLATGRTGAVALISPVLGPSRFDTSFPQLMHGVTSGLQDAGYYLLSMALPSDEGELPGLERLLDAGVVDGLILTRTRPRDARVALLQARGVPFVTHGRTLHNDAHAWVDTDNERAMRLAVGRLVTLGHRRIAMINGPGELTFALLRREGFTQGVTAAGLNPAHCPVVHSELTAAAAHAVAIELLHPADRAQRPTAIVCANDVLALGAAMACRQSGLRVGKDISLTGYGNSESAEFSDPPLTTIDHQVFESGRHLAALLMRRMAGEAPEGLHELEPVRLLERASTAPPP